MAELNPTFPGFESDWILWMTRRLNIPSQFDRRDDIENSIEAFRSIARSAGLRVSNDPPPEKVVDEHYTDHATKVANLRRVHRKLLQRWTRIGRLESEYFEQLEHLVGHDVLARLSLEVGPRFAVSFDLLINLLYELFALTIVVDAYKEWNQNHSPISSLRPRFRIEKSLIGFTFTHDKVLKLISPKLIPKLDADEVDISRLNRCSVCMRIYWVKRLGGQTCSRRCSLNFSQRRWRIKILHNELEKVLLPRLRKQEERWGPADTRVETTSKRIQETRNEIERISKMLGDHKPKTDS